MNGKETDNNNMGNAQNIAPPIWLFEIEVSVRFYYEVLWFSNQDRWEPDGELK